jgi:hypothetical protein
MIAHPLNSKPNKKIRKGNMGEKDKRKKQHPRKQEKVTKSFAITIILGKEPVVTVPSVGLSTRIGLEEERAKEGSIISSRS